MTYVKIIGAVVLLAACQPVTPNDYAGAGDGGFAASQQAQAARDAALTGQPVQVQPLNATVRPVAIDASPSNPAPVAVATTGALTPVVPATTGSGIAISDEQNFDAVANRETIESDAARIEANRQQYSVVQPTDLPTRQGNLPNIVDYALRTNNPVGVSLYRRIGFNKENRALRNCAKYATSDLAQQDFLARGGPSRDRRGLDPDGDGFACRWDPAPFRAIRASQ